MLAKVPTSGLLPRTTVAAMTSSANAAIESVLIAGSSGMILPPRTEVGLVAALTLGGVGEIAKAWRPLCHRHGLSLKMTGVFCHAAPLVTYKNAKAQERHCELADLLMVVDVQSATRTLRRASLIQAKMATAAERVSLSGRSSQVQLELYQNWPKFDFEDSVYGLSGVDFAIGGQTFDSGSFGVIDRHFKSPHWTQCAALPTPKDLAPHPTLGEFMAEMVDGARAGFGRLATPSLKTDWSKTVERLLEVTYARTFCHAGTFGSVSQPRGVQAFACLNLASRIASPLGDGGHKPPFTFEEVEDDRPSGLRAVSGLLESTWEF